MKTPEEKRQQRNEIAKRYRERNREKLRELQKARYDANPEKYLSNHRKWASENKERRSEYQRDYYLRRRDEYGKQKKDHYKSNKGSYIARSKKRKLDIQTLTPDGTCVKSISGFYEAAERLSGCLGIPFHVDHIVPISKGGLHHPSNLQALPAALNLRKSNVAIFIWSA